MNTPALDDAHILIEKYDGLDLGRRIDGGGQALLDEVRTRALVSIAESLAVIAAAMPTEQDRRQIVDALVGLEIQGRSR